MIVPGGSGPSPKNRRCCRKRCILQQKISKVLHTPSSLGRVRRKVHPVTTEALPWLNSPPQAGPVPEEVQLAIPGRRN